MGLVKTRRLAAMQKQQRAKAGMKLPTPKPARKCAPFPNKFPRSCTRPEHAFTPPPESAIIRAVESVSDTRKD